jgi:glyoxylase-like metal-dependent hydrolase (beta-lactamase superfamily II)
VLHVPGHSAGSLVFYCAEASFAIVGDVLFKGSIGRTDLVDGNLDLLLSGIVKKLYTLPDDTDIYPGHGPATDIGYEKIHNPFTLF